MKTSAKATGVPICLNIAKNFFQLDGVYGSRQVVRRSAWLFRGGV